MSPVSRFTPSLQPREMLEQIFVARGQLLDRITARVAESIGSSGRNHTLIVGPRGSGKTHLLALINYRVRDLIDAGGSLQLSWLREDPWAIVSYRHLLAEVIGHLEGTRLIGAPTQISNDALEARIRGAAERSGPVVVLIENFDQVLDQIGDDGQQRLRHLLQASRSMLLVATTTTLDRNLSDQARPFYGFFTTVRLDPFTVAQAQEMLRVRALAEGNERLAADLTTERSRARIQTIAHLTGGQPRLWAALSEALEIHQLHRLVDLLLTRFDDLTPYYQERLARLSPQQRLVIVELASADHPLHVAELAERIGVDQRSLGKTMTELADRGWTAPVRTPVVDLLDRRRTYYELAEPLARIAFQLKDTRGNPLPLVIDFLKGWFDLDEINYLDETHDLDRSTYVAQAKESLSGDAVINTARRLTGLTSQRVPALDLLATIDDSLAALCKGKPHDFLRLPVVVRTALESRFAPKEYRDSLPEIRAEIHRVALDEVGDTPHVIDPDWIGRAEDLADHDNTQGQTGRVVLFRWLIHSWRFGEAEALLVALTEALGSDHLTLFRARHDLARAYQAAGRPSQAIYSLGPAVEEMIRVLGPEHLLTLSARSNLAALRGEVGDAHVALTQLEAVLTDQIRVLGETHPLTFNTRNTMAHWRGESGDPAGAVSDLLSLLRLVEIEHGATDPLTLTSRHNLAQWRGESGDAIGAVSDLEVLIPLEAEVLGPQHARTLSARSNLAYWHGAAGQPDLAIKELEVLLPVQKNVLGRQHPDTLVTAGILGYWRTRLAAQARRVGRREP